MSDVKKRLKDLLGWSDRIGSDERHEINVCIKLLEKEENKYKKAYEEVVYYFDLIPDEERSNLDKKLKELDL